MAKTPKAPAKTAAAKKAPAAKAAAPKAAKAPAAPKASTAKAAAPKSGVFLFLALVCRVLSLCRNQNAPNTTAPRNANAAQIAIISNVWTVAIRSSFGTRFRSNGTQLRHQD